MEGESLGTTWPNPLTLRLGSLKTKVSRILEAGGKSQQEGRGRESRMGKGPRKARSGEGERQGGGFHKCLTARKNYALALNHTPQAVLIKMQTLNIIHMKYVPEIFCLNMPSVIKTLSLGLAFSSKAMSISRQQKCG